MRRLDKLLKGLHRLPEHFLPCLGLNMEKISFLGLRPAILDLCEAFDSRKGWKLEDTFAEWLSRQPWRHALPSVRMFFGHNKLWVCVCLRLLVANAAWLMCHGA